MASRTSTTSLPSIDLGRDVVRRRARRRRILDRGDVADRRVFHVEVVLADEDDRQLPHRREVQRLVERADVGRAVAEERDRDLVGPAQPGRPRRADRHRQVGADDGVGPEHALVGLGQVHRAALGLADAGRPAHQLGEALLGRGAAGHRVVVAAVGGERRSRPAAAPRSRPPPRPRARRRGGWCP